MSKTIEQQLIAKGIKPKQAQQAAKILRLEQRTVEQQQLIDEVYLGLN